MQMVFKINKTGTVKAHSSAVLSSGTPGRHVFTTMTHLGSYVRKACPQLGDCPDQGQIGQHQQRLLPLRGRPSPPRCPLHNLLCCAAGVQWRPGEDKVRRQL